MWECHLWQQWQVAVHQSERLLKLTSRKNTVKDKLTLLAAHIAYIVFWSGSGSWHPQACWQICGCHCLTARHKQYRNTFSFLWPFLSRLQQTASTSSPMEDRTASCSAFIVKIFCSNLTTLDSDARLCWRELSCRGLKTVWWLQDKRIITVYIDQNCQAWTLGTLHFPLRNCFFLSLALHCQWFQGLHQDSTQSIGPEHMNKLTSTAQGQWIIILLPR